MITDPIRIVIHASDTVDGPEYSWPAIKKYHVEHNGWQDIGYHAGVELIGTVPTLQIGRMWDETGAHTFGYNNNSLGFCFVGDFMVNPPVEAVMREGARIVKYWMRHFKIPITLVTPHKALNNTSCPGDAFDMDVFKAFLA